MKKVIQHICWLGMLTVLAVQQQAAGQAPSPKDSVPPKDTVQLKAVTVAATRPFMVQSADRITLNVAESPVAAGSNAYDVILRAPGVSADQSGKLSVRGRSVNVWIDGRPSNLSGEELKNTLQAMNGSSLDKVEVITHPSARYDAQGAAVINIKTLKGRNLGTNGTLTAGAGTGRFPRFNSGISLNYRSAKVNVYGSYDYNNNQQYYDNHSTRYIGAASTIAESEYDKRKRNSNSFRLGLDYDLNKTTSLGVLARGYLNYRNRQVENTTQLRTLQQPDSLSTVYTNGKARFFSPSVNIFFKKILNKQGSEITVNADYFRYNKSWEDHFITRFYDGLQKPYRQADTLNNHSPAHNDVYAVSADYTYPAKWGKLESGIKLTRTTTDNDVQWQNAVDGDWITDNSKTNHFIFHENISAAYINFSKTIGKYSIQAGVRAEQTSTEGYSVTLQQKNNNDYFNIFPNLLVQYAMSPLHVFGLGYKKNIVRYGFDYVNPFILYQSQYTYSQGNPYIRPQIDNSVELSYSYAGKLSASLTYARSTNSLTPVYRQDTVSKLIISSYDNLSEADFLYFTVMSNLSIGKSSSIINTASALYSAYHGTSGAGALDNKAFAAQFSSNYILKLSQRTTAEATGFYVTPVASGIYKVSSVFKIDIGISRKILQDRGSLKLSVSDIFNTLRSKYTVENYQNVNASYNNKPETRFFNLVFNYKFGNQYVKAGKNRKTGTDELRARMGSN